MIEGLDCTRATSQKFWHDLKDVLLQFLEASERATCTLSDIAIRGTYNDTSNMPVTTIAYNISMSSDALPDVLAALNTGILDGDFALSLNALGPYIITSIEGLYSMTNGVTSTPTPTSKPTGIPTSAIVENEGIKLTTVQVR